ncbi:MAG: phosphatidylinositol alpha-1,6-mannosyltransferase [Rhodothermales bacterium]
MDNLGGMQRVASELDRALAARADLQYTTRFLRAPWKTVHIRSAGFLLTSLFALWRAIRRGEVDVILFSSMVTASLAVLLRPVLTRQGVLAAAIVHGLDVTTPAPIYQWFVPKVFASLDLVLPVSAATGEQCVQRGLRRDQLQPVRNGVDPDRFPSPEFTRSERRRLLEPLLERHSLPDQATLLCSVGRQVARKGFAWFITEVMPLLPANVHYWLAGTGPEHAALQEAVDRAEGPQRVTLLGRVSEEELEALYRGADLFIMPNVPVAGDMEGFGVVMLEAGMNGMPAVGARLEGIAEVITDGQNGILVESGDAAGFADAIRGQLSQPGGLEKGAQNAYNFTMSNFSWESVAAEYVDVLRERLPRGSGN